MMQGSLAEKLRVLRARMGLSLTEAAARAGVTRDTLSDLEHGKRHPYMPTLSKIAAGYGVPVEELLGEPALAEKVEAPDTGQPGAEQTARDIAHAEALRQEAQDRKAANRTLASEGLDPATRISDIYDPAVYDVLRRKPSDELAGALLDAARDYVHAEQENAQLRAAARQKSGLANADPRAKLAAAKVLEEIADLWEDQLARGLYDRRTLEQMRMAGGFLAMNHEIIAKEFRGKLPPPHLLRQLEDAEERFITVGTQIWETLEEADAEHPVPPDELAARREAKREELRQQLRGGPVGAKAN